MHRAKLLCVVYARRAAMPQTLTLDHVSPATRLLEKRRQMFEVQEALDAQKEEFSRREDAFRRREEGLRKKDLELQESLIKFNKFLQENESKRNRAIKRASDEIKQRLAKEQDVARLKESLERFNDENEKLSNEETVPEDYPEITDLVNRYNTLKDANRDLSENQRLHESDNERKRVKFATFTKERTNDILNFNNEIASLQKQLETRESNAIRLQHDVDTTIRITSDKTLEVGQILMAVGNLLQRSTCGIHGTILKHIEVKDVPSTSDDHQDKAVDDIELLQNGRKAMADLDVIASYMVDFTAIVQTRIETQRAQKKAAAAAEGNSNGPSNVVTTKQESK
ncbi:hypothetical protein DYB37_008394 [Aphanomyces astaci]|uniref:DUF4200 domain-containing protein n=1 Tax=Aphanomyces astaci TaxID=112090 RepID=A0A3R7A7Y1_APHAT|nr:hypothetical protein DYB35_002546 [Aphanomyces astaci]RHZ16418.1 hypothetical protein DYB37_008394 [Aphanomyces astaci]